MKRFKGFALLLIVAAMGSCFDPPEFPNVPEIEFESIEFKEGPSTDSLILTISFRDGDGDLGIDPADLKYLSYPFNNLNFYQTDGGGNLVPLYTEAGTSSTGDTLNVLLVPNPGQGKLVFPRTRNAPGYSNLPAYNCVNYEYLLNTPLLVREDALGILDDETIITDTLYSPTFKYYAIQDTLYFTVNPDHYNIEVDFFVRRPGDPDADPEGWVEFDWREEFCTQSFDGRFPKLSQDKNALEGTLRYSMNSLGFTSIFSVQTLKLRIQIKDQALNKSNIVETGPFTLDQI